MKRRSKAVGKARKAAGRKVAKPKRVIRPEGARGRRPTGITQETELACLTRERDEALEQQTATADVLKVISRSTFDLQAVLDTLVESAARICQADMGNIVLSAEGGLFRSWATFGFSPEGKTEFDGIEFKPARESIITRALLERATVQSLDAQTDPEYKLTKLQQLGGYRSIIGTPLLREGSPIGAFGLGRYSVRPFTEKQIELLTTFANQAVIAIENARLFEAEQQRSRELAESLQQQTATAEVLKVISRSTFDLRTVLNTLVESAARLCNSFDAVILLREGEMLTLGAHYGPILTGVINLPISRTWTAGRAVVDRKSVQVHDLAAEGDEFPEGRALAIRLGHRTILSTPLLRDGEAIGCLTLRRTEVRSFTTKQVELAETFADQAVIAIGNVRLFDEVQARTRELTESLEQQTATSEVLRVISSSPTELQPVLDAIVQSAVKLCDGLFGAVNMLDGEKILRPTALYKYTPEALVAVERMYPMSPSRRQLTGRAILDRTVAHIPDVLADDDYAPGIALAGGWRAGLAVPMFREGQPIGTILVTRAQPGPFSERQIDLLRIFADQAVIAIENTRLFNELRESLQQQTATADVLSVISSSPGDLVPVFQAMLSNAVRICEASYGVLFRFESGAWSAAAMHGVPPGFAEFWQRGAQRPGPRTALGRVAETKQTVHIADVTTEPSYVEGEPIFVAAVNLGRFRTILNVPMVKDNELIGVFAIYRQEVRPFNDKQIELVQNFAAQAVIAIENTRLLNELRQRTDDLTESLEQQTATAKVLEVISRAAFDLQAVFETVVESSVRLCGADRAFIFRFDGELLRVAATYNATAEFREWVAQHPITPGRHSVAARAALERRTIHIPDALADPDYSYGVGAKGVEAYRTLLGVPILKGDDLLGVMVIYHLEVRPFTDKQIILVETFADQAAIAIENVRLLDELRQHTDALGRSVGELRALGEVSQAVNSTLDVETVLRTIVTKAVELSSTDAGAIYVFDEERDEFRLRATYGMSEAMIAAISDRHIGVGDANVGEAARRREPIQIADAETKRRAFEGGAEALLTKPIDFTMLRNEIDTRVGPAA